MVIRRYRGQAALVIITHDQRQFYLVVSRTVYAHNALCLLINQNDAASLGRACLLRNCENHYYNQPLRLAHPEVRTITGQQQQGNKVIANDRSINFFSNFR